MAEKASRKKSHSCVILTSEDEEEQDCMPKIINTISLQGCTELSFHDEAENEDCNFLYPECEIKEENSTENINSEYPSDLKDKTTANESIVKEEKNLSKEKKKVKLTRISPITQDSGPKPKPSTSRRDDSYNVVDARRLALQESLFKTKELFDTFLRVCQDQENNEQMERVVEKLSRAYGQARQEFLGSLEFQNILESETEKVNTSNSKPWLNLKLVLDEMKHNKKSLSSKLKLGDSEESQDGGGSNEDEPIIECPKKRRHLKKLEKTLRAINLKIKKLEEKEVDLSDDDSAYVKLDRYRTQFTKIYQKVCEIKGKLPDADRPYLRKVSFAGTTYPHINRCIERYYNKHRSFPDFQDIKKLVTIANQQEKIEMPPIKVHQMAAAAFKEFGEMLKRLRQYDDYDVIISYLDQQVDPAKNNEELQEELNKNAMLFKKKEQEVIDKFAAEDAGIHSNSEENADTRPKRKINKITVTNPRKKLPRSVNKRNLSSSESSDEEEKEIKPVVTKNLSLCLSSNSSSESENDSAKIVKKVPVSKKGKTIVGKKTLVKKVSKLSSPEKRVIKNTALSSDEENTPNNSKDSFANYLGLQVASMKSETKETSIKDDSDEEITCIKEIKKSSPSESNGIKRNSLINSSDSDSSKHQQLSDVEMKSERNDSSNEKPMYSSKSDKEVLNRRNNKEDNSSSCSERTTITKNIGKITNKTVNKNNVKSNQKQKKVLRSKKESSDSSSDNSSDDRTSDASDFSEKKKSISDLELSSGNKCVSDSSDDEDKDTKVKTVSDEDEPIILSEDPVILSEEVPLTAKPSEKKAELEDSSDSDDIYVLSQNSGEMRTVAPRRTKASDVSKKSTSLSNKYNAVNAQNNDASGTLPRKRPFVATSTPLHKKSNPLKRILSNQSSSGNNNKRPRHGSSNGVNVNKQQTISQIINGAARKVATRTPPVCRSPNSAESIPLIELD